MIKVRQDLKFSFFNTLNGGFTVRISTKIGPGKKDWDNKYYTCFNKECILKAIEDNLFYEGEA